MNEDRFLVTGGCGFVGSRLVRKLVEQGRRVFVVDDLSLGVPDNLGEAKRSVDIVELDLRDAEATARVFREVAPHYVIHLAAIHFIPACDRDPKRCIDVNVGGTQSVLNACDASSIRSVVLASTAAVYAPADSAHHEDSAVGPTDIYGLTKLWTEQLADRFHRLTGHAVGVARLFNVFGPGETNPHLIPAIIAQAASGSELQLGDLTTKRDYVFVDDVADALMAMSAAAEATGYCLANVGRGEEVDGSEIVAAIGELLGHRLRVETDPARVRTSDRPHLLSDSSYAHELLGWRALTDLNAGLLAAIAEPSAAGLTLS
jgi:UDP-glucose 4-epimerase